MGLKFSFGGQTWVHVHSNFDLSSYKQFVVRYIWVLSNTKLGFDWFDVQNSKVWEVRGSEFSSGSFQAYIQLTFISLMASYSKFYISIAGFSRFSFGNIMATDNF